MSAFNNERRPRNVLRRSFAKSAAEASQRAGAHDAAPQMRLVARPGTGKSYSIEESVCRLLGRGVRAQAIAAVSFTRASPVGFHSRIEGCDTQQAQRRWREGQSLHSFALQMLKAAGIGGPYLTPIAPSRHLVLIIV